MCNIIADQLISMKLFNGSHSEASLPEVYAALMADEVESFPALRPHQRHAWHAFLVQLGAMAMHRAGLTEPPSDPEEWLRIIRALTPDYPNDEPWQLVVDDITRPAFMQPPARSKERVKDYKNAVATPDELDMLVTSKNHDLKSAVAEQASVDDWIFALITLQTMEGFGGAGNYGISRMNGGLGSRPAFTLAPTGGLGAHASRDISALPERRQELLDDNPHYPTSGGATLLWTLPWDGTASEALLPNHLDLLYIEVCRLIRLRSDSNSHIYAIRTSSKAARIEAKSLNGLTGDPWALIDRRDKKGDKVLTLPGGGFSYKRVSDYLTSGGEYKHPPLLSPTQSEMRSPDPIQLVARAMVRGQGKTEGYHERRIPVRHKFKLAMLRRNRGDLDDMGAIAQARITDVGKVQRILSHAIQVFVARGDSDKVSPEHRNLARPWLNRLDEIVDTSFFDALQTEFEADDADRKGIRNEWLLNGKDGVIDHARTLLHDAADALPCPAIQRYKARVGAEGLFEGRIRGQAGLPFLFNKSSEE